MAFINALPLPSRTSSPCQSAHLVRPNRPNLPRPARTAPRMLVVEAGSADDMDKILAAADDALVVVDYSTTWCGPCRMIAPVFEEMSEKHTDVVFVKVMGDVTTEAADLMRREGIRAVPAFHFWRNKKRVKDITGAKSEDVEKSLLELKDKAKDKAKGRDKAKGKDA